MAAVRWLERSTVAYRALGILSAILLACLAIDTNQAQTSAGLTYAQLALGGSYQTVLVVSNESSTAWSGTANLRKGNDQSWTSAWTLNGAAKTGSTSFDISLGPKATRKFVLAGDDTTRSGYLTIQSSTSINNIATAFFYNYIVGNQLIDSIGVPPSYEGRAFTFAAEKSASVNTGLAYVSSVKTGFPIKFTLFDGVGRQVQQVTLNYDGQSARFFTGPGGGIFPGIADGFVGSLVVESDQNLCMTVLRMENTPDGVQYTSFPPHPAAQSADPRFTYAQLALGGEYQTVLIVSNESSSIWAGRATLRRANDQSWSSGWTLNSINMTGSSSFDISLGPKATARYVLVGDSQVRSGYLAIQSDSSPMGSIATAFFYNYVFSNKLIDSIGIAHSPEGRSFTLPVEKSAMVNTGLAFVSYAGTGFQVKFTLYDSAGNQVQQQTIPYTGQSALFFCGAGGIFSGIPDGFVGSLAVEAGANICMTVLRMEMTATGLQYTGVPPHTTTDATPQTTRGSWKGTDVSFNVDSSGSIRDFVHTYKVSATDCNNCKISIGSLPTSASRIDLRSGGLSFSGSFTDSTHMTGTLTISSTNCPRSGQTITAVKVAEGLGGGLHSVDGIVGNMRFVPATGSAGFTQGSPSGEIGHSSYEAQFTHILSKSFAVMETEVTQQMWADLRSAQPSLPADPLDTSHSMSEPVDGVKWFEAILFANLLSARNGLTRCYYKDADFRTPIDATNYLSDPIYCNFSANGYRLPSEGEWEYFARAGSSGPFHIEEPKFNSTTKTSCTAGALPALESVAWFCANSGGSLHPVGLKLANAWNLKDVHGNAEEWCWDRDGYYPSGTVTDYLGTSGASSNRMARGGSANPYVGDANLMRLAHRYSYGYQRSDDRYGYVGLRLVRTLN